MMQRTLVLLKPDCVQRNLIGEIISRFEKKGLKIVGMKMVHLDDEMLTEHYAHHKDKPFFQSLKEAMKRSPVVAIALEGYEGIQVVRTILGATSGREADVGSIRGDFSISVANNLVHASDSPENAKIELERFFDDKELFDYKRVDLEFLYAEDEL